MILPLTLQKSTILIATICFNLVVQVCMLDMIYQSYEPTSRYPYVTLIKMTVRNSYCSGTLLSANWVLTASHCVFGEQGNTLVIFLGFVNKTILDTDFCAMNATVQERWSQNYLTPWSNSSLVSFGKYDIALIETKEPFDISRKRRTPITPNMFNPSSPRICEMVGYDVDANFLDSKHFEKENNFLLVRKMLVEKPCSMNSKVSKEYFHPSNSWICQTDNNPVQPTFANSGAMLFCKEEHVLGLKGIAVGNYQDDGPMIFTDICEYLSWIRVFVGSTIVSSPGRHGFGCLTTNHGTKQHFNGCIIFILVLYYTLINR